MGGVFFRYTCLFMGDPDPYKPQMRGGTINRQADFPGLR